MAPTDDPEPLRPTLDDAPSPTLVDDGTDDEAPAEGTTEQLPAAAGDEAPTDDMPARELARPVQPPRRASRVVWYLVGGLLLAAVVGPLVFWLAFWRFRPTAQHHIPAGTVLAVRIDARELFLFDPFREHVLPAMAPRSDDPARPTTLQRIRTHTGVDLRGDVREIVVATTDGARWAVLLGGRFQTSVRRAPFLDGLEQAMDPEPGSPAWSRDGDVLVGPAGVAVAQADDGTILLTSTADVARASLHATDDYRELWLSSAGDVSFSIGEAALLRTVTTGRGALPQLAVLERVERITGWVHLDEVETEITLDVVPQAGEAVEGVTADLEALVRVLAERAAAAPPADGARAAIGGEATARALAAKVLGGAKVQARAGSVLVTAVAPGAEVDAALRDLGAALDGVAPR